jgi:hypothetical protein
MIAFYHITFEAYDGRIVEANVEADYTPGEGFNSFYFDDVAATDLKTNETELFGEMPSEYLSDAEYAAEGSLPTE